jgi:hypothetical protein
MPGPGFLKIMAVEHPSEFAKLTGALLPKQFDDEMPAVTRIVTGVPRAGEELPPGYFDKPPQIPSATPEQLPSPVKEGDDA